MNVGDCRNYLFVTIILMVILRWNCRSENAVFIGGARVGKGAVGGRNARLEECKSFFSLFIFTGKVLR
jgi:hypothetical protein